MCHRPLGSNGHRGRNKLISVSNVKIQMTAPSRAVDDGVCRQYAPVVCICGLICRSISVDAEGAASCTHTCWCSILISATSLWSSSCSLLSSSHACFTWLCSLTSWMLSCLTASSSSFSWACSPARRLCSVLRRYRHKYHQTVSAASHASNQHHGTFSQTQQTNKQTKVLPYVSQDNKCSTGEQFNFQTFSINCLLLRRSVFKKCPSQARRSEDEVFKLLVYPINNLKPKDIRFKKIGKKENQTSKPSHYRSWNKRIFGILLG